MNDLRELRDAFSPAPEHYVAHMRLTLDNMEELVVKRRHKIFLGILVFVLVLTIGTALAYTLISNQYFQDVAKVQFEHGYYEDWSLNEKLTLLQLMKDNGVDMDDTEADALLAGDGMTDAQREARVDKLIVDRYGINGRTDVITLESILTKELGDFDGWPMEQKAWYSQMLIDSGLMGSDDDIYRMPGEDAITPEEAVEVARGEIMAVWGLSKDDLDACRTVWVYRTHVSDEEEKLLHYEVFFEPESGDGYTYSCAVGNDGKVLTNEDNMFVMSPAEEKAAMEGTDASFEEKVSKMIMAYGDAHGLGGQSMSTWPLEDKLAVTEEIRPVIQAQLAADPDSVTGEFRYYATHRYGLPDERALTLEQAVETARNALVTELGVPQAMAEKCTSRIYCYDVTDPDAPLWKITLAPYDDFEEMEARGEETESWIVRLNAYTGAIVKAQLIDFGSLSNEELVEIRN